jgi:hypothetical protein
MLDSLFGHVVRSLKCSEVWLPPRGLRIRDVLQGTLPDCAHSHSEGARSINMTTLNQNLRCELARAFYTCKGIVQRDLTGVKTRLKRSVMMNYIVANFAF